jgi:hypothetical protein
MSHPKNLVDYDVRVRDRNLKAGLLSKEQVDSYVSSLPDVANLAQPVEITQPGTPPEDKVPAEAPKTEGA